MRPRCRAEHVFASAAEAWQKTSRHSWRWNEGRVRDMSSRRTSGPAWKISWPGSFSWATSRTGSASRCSEGIRPEHRAATRRELTTIHPTKEYHKWSDRYPAEIHIGGRSARNWSATSSQLPCRGVSIGDYDENRRARTCSPGHSGGPSSAFTTPRRPTGSLPPWRSYSSSTASTSTATMNAMASATPRTCSTAAKANPSECMPRRAGRPCGVPGHPGILDDPSLGRRRKVERIRILAAPPRRRPFGPIPLDVEAYMPKMMKGIAMSNRACQNT